MTWNYRIVVNEEKDWCGIHEVFYNEKNEIMYYTNDPIDIVSEDPESLIKQLEVILRDAKDSPVLYEPIKCVGDRIYSESIEGTIEDLSLEERFDDIEEFLKELDCKIDIIIEKVK